MNDCLSRRLEQSLYCIPILNLKRSIQLNTLEHCIDSRAISLSLSRCIVEASSCNSSILSKNVDIARLHLYEGHQVSQTPILILLKQVAIQLCQIHSDSVGEVLLVGRVTYIKFNFSESTSIKEVN